MSRMDGALCLQCVTFVLVMSVTCDKCATLERNQEREPSLKNKSAKTYLVLMGYFYCINSCVGAILMFGAPNETGTLVGVRFRRCVLICCYEGLINRTVCLI